MSIPNLFTLLRIVLIPLFGWMWWSGHHSSALGIFVVAALTDWLDGLLARLLDQRSRLGALLDPAADKLMLLVSFPVAASLGVVPWWLCLLVLGRDLVLALGALALTYLLPGRFGRDRWRPSRIGKYATFYQLFTIGLGLLARAIDSPALYPWLAALILITAVTTSISSVQYVGRALRAIGQPPPPATVTA